MSKIPNARVNALNTKLIWIWLSPRSFIISGAVREIQTRSRYVRLAKSTAKTKIR